MEEKEDKTSCIVCTEHFNKITHKKIICCYCLFESCNKCVQKYILLNIQDPHCMNCKKVWNREYLDEKMSKLFINNELKNHRENILFEKEKNLLPETQENVKLIIQQEEIESEIKSIELTIDKLQKKIEELDKKKRDINPYQVIRNNIHK